MTPMEMSMTDAQPQHSLPSTTKMETTPEPKDRRKEPPNARQIRYTKQIGIVLATTTGYLSAGMAISWPNALTSDIQTDNSTFFGNQLQLSDWQKDMIGSMIYSGGIPGFVFGGWLVAWLGRRRSMLPVVVPGVMGWALVAFSLNSTMILIGRFSCGLAYAALGVAVRSYLVEIADTPIRGAAIQTTDVMKNAGSIFVIGLGMLIPWYYLAMFCVCHLLFYALLVIPFIPESPMYLVITGREEEALKVLVSLRGSYVDLEEEIKQLKQQNARADKARGWGVLLKPDILRKCCIILGLFLISNFSGTEVIKVNALRMLQSSGLSLEENMSTIIVFSFLLGGSIFQVLAIDRIGRRMCLILSLVLLMIAYAILGTYVYLDSPVVEIILLRATENMPVPDVDLSSSSISKWSWIPTICLMAAAFGGSLGIGTIPWILSVEYFPTNIRSQVMSVCAIVGHLLSFTALEIYSPLQNWLTPAGLYWSYCGFAFIGIIYTMLIVTETKGRRVG